MIQIYFRDIKNINTLESSMNSELNKVNTWLCGNKLSLNVEKSNFVLFHPIQRKISSNFVLTINNNNIPRYMFVKYLGILIDSNLSWKSHIDSICKKIKRSIGMLSKLRYYVPLKILVNLYYTLIYPFLTYDLGTETWNNIDETVKLFSFHKFKKRLKDGYIDQY